MCHAIVLHFTSPTMVSYRGTVAWPETRSAAARFRHTCRETVSRGNLCLQGNLCLAMNFYAIYGFLLSILLIHIGIGIGNKNKNFKISFTVFNSAAQDQIGTRMRSWLSREIQWMEVHNDFFEVLFNSWHLSQYVMERYYGVVARSYRVPSHVS